MKRQFAVCSAVIVTLLAGLASQPLLAWDPANPDDPAAHAAAKEALQALGPDRGALTIKSAIYTLVGLELGTQGKGLEISGQVEALEKVIEELGAKVTETEIKIELSADVLFDFDQSDLRPEPEADLNKVATVLKAHPKAIVLIEGHTDAKGADAYNLTLSEKRAASVKRWLVDKGGADGKHLVTKGWGKSKPVAPNAKPDGSDNPEGRQKNRRVEITIKKSARHR